MGAVCAFERMEAGRYVAVRLMRPDSDADLEAETITRKRGIVTTCWAEATGVESAGQAEAARQRRGRSLYVEQAKAVIAPSASCSMTRSKGVRDRQLHSRSQLASFRRTAARSPLTPPSTLGPRPPGLATISYGFAVIVMVIKALGKMEHREGCASVTRSVNVACSGTPRHVPARQASLIVAGSPSSQSVPSGSLVKTQLPQLVVERSIGLMQVRVPVRQPREPACSPQLSVAPTAH